MRWADLDSLNHVNNVVYVDYAAEAQAMLVDDGVLAADLTVSRTTVEFLRPLLLSSRPVTIFSTLDGRLITQEIGVARDGGQTIFARVATTFGARESLRAIDGVAEAHTCRVRRSDLAPSGVVSPVKVFELFQEGRIMFVANQLKALAAGSFVVARVDVTYGSDITWRRQPYDVVSRISRVGSSSVTIEAEIVDGPLVHARATSVLVGYDLEAQHSRAFNAEERAAFAAFSPPD
jgi:acyl-CoA thioester hydrolase